MKAATSVAIATLVEASKAMQAAHAALVHLGDVLAVNRAKEIGDDIFKLISQIAKSEAA